MSNIRSVTIAAGPARMPDLKKSGHRALQTTGLACVLAISTAGAAHATNKVGWVWANQPNATTAYTPDTSYSYNSANGTITIVPVSTGVYTVEFGGLYDGGPDDIQVSAYSTSGYCQSDGWSPSGTTLDATVGCFDANGNPANSYFTLLYQSRNARLGTSSKGLAFLWANEPTTASYTPATSYQYNSTGGTNTIVRNGVGNYTATLPGLTAIGGDVQVTAYEGTSRCKVGSWGSSSGGTSVNVLCFNSTGAAADEFYDLAYAIKEPFGLVHATTSRGAWAWANNDTSFSVYTPSTTYQYNGFATGHLKAQETTTGNYTVTIPGSFAYITSHVLVTGYNSGSNYCNIVNWGTTTMNLACYSQGGVPVESQFDVTFQTFN